MQNEVVTTRINNIKVFLKYDLHSVRRTGIFNKLRFRHNENNEMNLKLVVDTDYTACYDM